MRLPEIIGTLLLLLLAVTTPGRGWVSRSMSAPLPSPDSLLEKTNMECFQTVLHSMAADLLTAASISPGESLMIRTGGPGTDVWVVENSMIEALKRLGAAVFDTTGQRAFTGWILQLNGIGLSVRYADMYREGFLGEQRVRRTVRAVFSVKAYSPRGGEVRYSGSMEREYADTVSVDDIPRLELPSVPSTHAVLPRDSFFDRILEPAVIIGATGVAVYLFFHVRT